VKNGASYQLTFSSYGQYQSETVEAYLYDVADPGTHISNIASVSSGNNSWTRQTMTLTATANAANAGVLLFINHDGSAGAGSGTRTVFIDEVRLSQSSAIPSVKSSVTSTITSLGIKSVRWPGGTLIDFFNWKDSVGPLHARGEEQASASFQTPSFGLHEFLDYCESIGVTPVLQVNFLKGASDASDLVEYVLGNSSTTQGAIRAANGRSRPWNATIFEVGNEPTMSYKGSGPVDHAALAYATAAKPVIASIKAKAAALGVPVKVSGIIEPTFQLAEWLSYFASDPDPAYAIDRMLYNWNMEALGQSGIGAVDFLDGHFYGYRKYDPSMTEAQAFPYVMGNGALLAQTLADKISPLSSAPVWITEFNIYPEEDTTHVVHTERMMDFQSGLAIGDIINSMITYGIEGAQMWNLAQPWFGMMQNPDSGDLRPAGIVFSLFSPMAGEEKIRVSIDLTEKVTVGTGSGSMPTGLSYPLISAIATKNAITGKARIILINRSYADSKSVRLTFDSPISGNANVLLYNNSSLSANNETAHNVAITQSTTNIPDPFVVTLAPHSITRIDMQ
ncbi:MAG TPA: hypothetical protein VF857_03270, partial [Spirochaetota bacterium]